MILHTYENKEYGITSQVVKSQKGYAVILKDDDAGENLPVITTYHSEAVAMQKAMDLVA